MRVPEYADPIRVRWYPVEDLAPGSYELTDYSSSNWDSDPKSYDPDLGEQSTTRDPWRDWRYCLPPPFDPTTLEGLYAWFREGTGEPDGNARDSWPDKTDHGYDLVQVNPAAQPLYVPVNYSNNTYDGMLFTSGLYFDVGTAPQLGTDWTMFILYQRTGTNDVSIMNVVQTTSLGGVNVRDNLAAGVDTKGVDVLASNTVLGAADFDWTFDRPLSIVAVRNDRSFKLWIGGRLKVNTPLNSQGVLISSLIQTVGQQTGGPFGLFRFVSEIAIWNRALSKWEAGAVNEYAKFRYPAAFD